MPDDRWLWDNEPCRAACPVHTDAGAYVTAIAEGRLHDAYLIARRPNPFASICGGCAPPCETACRTRQHDEPVAIRALKRFVTERFGVESFAANSVWHEAHGPVPPATFPSVGVVGGGPRDWLPPMSCGWPVIRSPSTRPPTGSADDGARHPRVPPRTGVDRPRDRRCPRAGDRHRAVVPGRPVTPRSRRSWPARRPSWRWVPDGDGTWIYPGTLDGIPRAVEFLLNVNRGYRADLRPGVVVVGGGNVAFDVARTALRAQAGDPGRRRARRSGSAGRHTGRRPARHNDHTRTSPAPPSGPACWT